MNNWGIALILLTLAAASCGPAPKPQPAPTPSSAPEVVDDAMPLGRLPTDVKPLAYELALEVDPRQPKFRGTIAIDIELTRPRRILWLHGNGLTVSDASVTPTGGTAIPAKYEQVHEGGVAKLTLEGTLHATTARISMRFEGPFDDRNNGLYRVQSGGEWYAFTQMEPIWTRKAFPCFDEPAFKTPFDVSIVADPAHTVIANTRETGREKFDEGHVRVRFAKTERLPTYLIALAVGPLDVVEAPALAPNAARKTPLPFRGVAVRGRGKELTYALAHTPALLEELEEYFATPYPYDKLDIIAVPEKGGAMENAGLITFREWLLLLDDDAPIQQKHAFAYVMAHELAHQWFGNLVTMPWWNDIWLNEAFATWMGYRAVHAVNPDYEANMRALSGVHGAMSVDSLTTARQIRQPVDHNDHIHAAFDVITYRKGGGVLGMVERWLGKETFREGMRRYMRKHAHGSAAADDLLAVLTDAAGRDVGTPFRTFLLQPGLPNVHASLRCDGTPKVSLTQTRYLPHGSSGGAAQKWQIPVCLRYATGGTAQEKCVLLAEPNLEVPLEGPCPAWIMPNAGAAGYYQWSLPPAQIQALVTKGLRHLDTAELTSVGRAVLDMMRAGKLDAVQTADALTPLTRISHPDVVRAPMHFIQRLRTYLEGDPQRTEAEQLGRRWFKGAFSKLGFKAQPREKQSVRLLRTALVGFMLHGARDPGVHKRATALARRYLGLDGNGELDRSAIDANFAGTVLAAAGETGDATFFDAALAHFEKAKDAELRGNLLAAMSHAHEPALAARARQLTLDPRLRLNEAMRPIWAQMSMPETRPATWSWLRENVDPIMARLPPRRAGWLPSVSVMFCDGAKADEMKAFFEPLLPKMPGGRREIDKAAEAMRLCAARKDKHLPKVRELLAR